MLRPLLAHLMLFDPQTTLEISTSQYLSLLERMLLRPARIGNQEENESFSAPLFDRWPARTECNISLFFRSALALSLRERSVSKEGPQFAGIT